MTTNHASSGHTPFRIGQIGGEPPQPPEMDTADPVVNERTGNAHVGVQADEIGSIDIRM